MKNNTNNKPANNVGEPNTDRGSSGFNKPRDLSLNSINKPWYKKKGSIIAMSSTLGAGILTTAVVVPVILTAPSSVPKVAELSKVMTVYDLTAKTAKLIVNGQNLPSDTNSYDIYKVTTTKTTPPTPITNVTLYAVSETEVYLDFKDEAITAQSIYQVKLKNSTSAGNEVVSKQTENVIQPSFTITKQPESKTILSVAPNQTVTLSTTISAITNPVDGALDPSYQWQISDSETGQFTSINSPEARKAEFIYNAKDLSVNTKKYFRCKIRYQYMNPIISAPVSIIKIIQPVITINEQPTSLDLKFIDSTATLSVGATIQHGVSGQAISYQWTSSSTEEGTFTPITDATSSSYVLTKAEVSTITPGVKKYFKCKLSSNDATLVETNVVYINRALAPVITISKQPTNIELPYMPTNPTLAIEATVANGEQSKITYEWQYKDSDKPEEGTWSVMPSITSPSFVWDQPTLIQPGAKRYFKCLVGYEGINSTPSDIFYVSRAAQPVIRITTQPTTVALSHTDTSASLTVAAALDNGATSQTLNYQWLSSDTETGAYVPVSSGGNSNTYNLTNVSFGFSKYYKCEITSDNANKVTSSFARVSRLLQPVITISKHPEDVSLNSVTSGATLTVAATVANGVANQVLTYQWQSSDAVDGTYENITDQTKASIALTDVAFGSSKYYKCIVNSANAVQVISKPAHVSRVVQPSVIHISNQLSNQTLAFDATTASAFTITASVTPTIEGQELTYQWQISDSVDSGFTNIESATSATYMPTDLESITPGVKKYYKCVVSYTNAESKSSNVVYIERSPQEITPPPPPPPPPPPIRIRK
ncbi:MAG: hypothetical protein RR697_02020 [Malacoplasma sp.]